MHNISRCGLEKYNVFKVLTSLKILDPALSHFGVGASYRFKLMIHQYSKGDIRHTR